jgi:uncharacterized protein YggE
MNSNVTVSARSLLVAVLVLLALVVAYLLGGSDQGGTPAQAADEPAAPDAGERRVLTMSGTGTAQAVPDELSFGVAVSVTRADLDAALDAANGTMARVLGSLERHGVARSDVQTTGLSTNPVYDYHPYSAPTIRGYRVTERATVLVKDLTDGGAAVSAAVATGGNSVRVSDVRLLVGDTDTVMAKARAAAVEEATAKAGQYAAASGQTLGEVVTLREVGSRAGSGPRPVFGAMAMDQVDARKLAYLPVRPGRDRSTVTVQVVWELE